MGANSTALQHSSRALYRHPHYRLPKGVGVSEAQPVWRHQRRRCLVRRALRLRQHQQAALRPQQLHRAPQARHARKAVHADDVEVSTLRHKRGRAIVGKEPAILGVAKSGHGARGRHHMQLPPSRQEGGIKLRLCHAARLGRKACRGSVGQGWGVRGELMGGRWLDPGAIGPTWGKARGKRAAGTVAALQSRHRTNWHRLRPAAKRCGCYHAS